MLKESESKFQLVEVKNQSELRTWLHSHHTQRQSVWLVTYKKSVPEFYVSYSELVDECLCFGWIDSLPQKLDEQRTAHLISPRNPKSNWSRINKNKAESLIRSGLMQDSGLTIVMTAKSNGSWDALERVDRLELSDVLIDELERLPPAAQNFESFPPSIKRGILEWIQSAKRPETHQKRCKLTAQLAQRGERILGS